MKLDLNPIKTKILEETKEKRMRIYEINEKYCAKRKKRRIITYSLCIVLVALVLFFIGYRYSWWIVVLVVFIPLVFKVLMFTAFGESSSNRYGDEEVLKEDQAEYDFLTKFVVEKKDQLVKSDKNLSEYLRYLCEQYISFKLANLDGLTDDMMRGKEREFRSDFYEHSFLHFSSWYSYLYFDFHSNAATKYSDPYGYRERAQRMVVDDDHVANGTICFRNIRESDL